METDAPEPPPATEDTADVRERRRRADAALRGRILAGGERPTVEQLLRGYPFACGDMVKDSREFALVLAEWAHDMPGSPVESLLRHPLRALECTCTLATASALAEALAVAGRRERHPELLGAFLRCRIYMAHLGSEEAVISVAADAALIASAQDWEREGDALDVVWQSLGWLLHYARLRSRSEAGTAPDGTSLATGAVVRDGAGMFEVRVRRSAARASGHSRASNGLPHADEGRLA